jgi:UDP:flavonoid glycosyltransferase YjiC (YdhE family)
MGSGSKHMMDPPNFNEITVEVAKKYRSILLGKSDVTHDNVFVCDFPVPHSKLFPLASLVVTHGGIGTIGKCLASNTPQIAVPQMPENKVNADLLSYLIEVIDPADYNINRISDAIENCKYNFEIGEQYSSAINSIDVIDIIEKTINN